jgi:hypothetical protein
VNSEQDNKKQLNSNANSLNLSNIIPRSQQVPKEVRLLLFSSTIPATAVEPAAMPGCSIAMMTPSANTTIDRDFNI